MAISATFKADFASFVSAVSEAETKLKSFQSGAVNVENALKRVGDSFSGRKMLSEATLAVKAVTDLGGVARLTEAEQRRLNSTVTEALAKYKALGQQAPREMVEIQKALRQTESDASSLSAKTVALKSAMESLSGRKVIQEATLMATAIEKLGGTSKLTAVELQRAATQAAAAADKMRALGLAVPTNVQVLANHLKPLPDAMTLAGRASSFLASSFGQVTAAFGAAALIGTGIVMLKRIASQAFETAGNLVDMSAKTGLSIKSLQEMEGVAKQTGTTIDAFTTAAYKLGINLSGGSSSVQAAVKALGLSFQEIQRLKPDQQFDTITAALGRMEDPQERNRLALQLFGKTAGEILPAVGEGYRDLANQVTIASDESVIAMDKMADKGAAALSRLGTRMMAFGGEAIQGAQNLKAWMDLGLMGASGEPEAPRDVQLPNPNAAASKAFAAFKAAEIAKLKEYKQELIEVQNELDNLSASDREQLAAAQKLGKGTDELTAKFNLSEEAVRMFSSQIKTSVSTSSDAAKKSSDAAKQYAAELANISNVLTGQNAITAVNKLMDAFQGSIPLTQMTAEAQRQVANTLAAGAVAWELQGRAVPESVQKQIDAVTQLRVIPDALKTINDATKETAKALREDFWSGQSDQMARSTAALATGILANAKLQTTSMTNVSALRDRLEGASLARTLARVDQEFTAKKDALDKNLVNYTTALGAIEQEERLTVREITRQWEFGESLTRAQLTKTADHLRVQYLNMLRSGEYTIDVLNDKWEEWQDAAILASDRVQSNFSKVMDSLALTPSMDGLKQGLANLAQQAPGLIADLFKGGQGDEIGKNIAAAIGAALGSYFGPIGAAAGAAAGNAIAEGFRTDGEDVVRRLGHDWGIYITEEVGNAIAADAHNLFPEPAKGGYGLSGEEGNLAAAEVYNLGALIKQTGLNADNTSMFARKLRDAFVFLSEGTYTAAQATTVLDESFTQLADHAARDGRLISAELLEIIDLTRRWGLESEAVQDFVDGMLQTATQGLGSVVGAFTEPLTKAFDERDKSTEGLDKLLESRTSLVSKLQDAERALRTGVATDAEEDRVKDLRDELKDLDAQIGKVRESAGGFNQQIQAIASPERFARLGRLTSAMFGANQSQGMTLIDNIRALTPALEGLQRVRDDMGYQSGEEFAFLMHISNFVKNNPALANAIDGLNSMMTGLHNAGLLTQDTFGDLGAEAVAVFNQIQGQGVVGSQALMLMQPTLQKLWELQHRFGYELGVTEEALLAQAAAAGLVGEAHMSAEERTAENTRRMAEAMERLGTTFERVFMTGAEEAEDFARRAAEAVNSIPRPEFDFPTRGGEEVARPYDEDSALANAIPMATGGVGPGVEDVSFLENMQDLQAAYASLTPEQLANENVLDQIVHRYIQLQEATGQVIPELQALALAWQENAASAALVTDQTREAAAAFTSLQTAVDKIEWPGGDFTPPTQAEIDLFLKNNPGDEHRIRDAFTNTTGQPLQTAARQAVTAMQQTATGVGTLTKSVTDLGREIETTQRLFAEPGTTAEWMQLERALSTPDDVSRDAMASADALEAFNAEVTDTERILGSSGGAIDTMQDATFSATSMTDALYQTDAGLLTLADTLVAFAAQAAAVNASLSAPQSFAVDDPTHVIPMAQGGFGRVTKPTLFLAGEAGAEDVAFSGAGQSFGSGGRGATVINLTANIQIDGANKDSAELARELAPRLVEEIRRNSRGTRTGLRVALGVA